MTTNKNVLLWFRRFYAEQWILILLMINSLVDGSSQKGKSDPTISLMTGFNIRDATIPSPIDDERQYVLMNGIYMTNPKFRMALTNPTMLMRPQSAASYAEVSARTSNRKINTRIDTPKLSLPSQDDTTDGSVIFRGTTRPSATATTRPTVTTRTVISDGTLKGGSIDQIRVVPDKKDFERCKNNPLTCNETSFYPKDYIQKLILDKKINKELLPNDVLKDEIVTRLDGDGDDGSGRKQFCDSTQLIQFPKIGNTKDGEIRFIIQSPEFNISQGIRVESCVSKGDSSCGALKNHLPPTYQLECVQKYSFRNLVSLTSTGPVREQFEIPSCCVCMYRDRK